MSVPTEDRPPVDHDVHTEDLPPLPQRESMIPATRWIEAPDAVRHLGTGIDVGLVAYIRTIHGYLLWRAGRAAGERARYCRGAQHRPRGAVVLRARRRGQRKRDRARRRRAHTVPLLEGIAARRGHARRSLTGPTSRGRELSDHLVDHRSRVRGDLRPSEHLRPLHQPNRGDRRRHPTQSRREEGGVRRRVPRGNSEDWSRVVSLDRRWDKPTAFASRTVTSPGPRPAKQTTGDADDTTSGPWWTRMWSTSRPRTTSVHAHASPNQAKARPTSSSHSGSPRGTKTSIHTAPGSRSTAPPPLPRLPTATPRSAAAAWSTSSAGWVEPRTSEV